MVGGFGQGAGAGGCRSVGVPDGDGEAGGDLGAGAQSGAELSGQVQEGPAVLGGVEFVAGEAVLGARGAGDGFGEDGPVVVSVCAVVEGASGTRAEEALDRGEGRPARSPTVWTPCWMRRRAVVGPTPVSSRTGRGRRNAATASSSTVVRCPGV